MKPRSQRPQDEGPFGWQARNMAALAGQIGIQQHSVYCALSHFESAAAQDHKKRFAVSYEQLAQHLNCSTKTIQRCLGDLQKAKLIFTFSGANGSRRATRNCFFLVAINKDSQSYGKDLQSQHTKDSQSYRAKDSQSFFNKKENNISAPPQAAAGDIEKEEHEPACPPLRGGSGSKNDQAEITKPEDLARLARMKAALGFL
jgi:hypothetical protein